MKKSKKIILPALCVIFAALSVFAFAKAFAGRSAPEKVPSPSDIVPVEQIGLQFGESLGAVLFADKEATTPLALLAEGEQIAVVERFGEMLLCRSGLFIGWVKEEEVELFDEMREIHTASSQSELSEKQENALADIFEEYGCISAAVCVIENGDIKYDYAYGVQEKGTETLCTADTKYRVASISKVLVAMSAMAMNEQGVISLDDDFAPYLSERMLRNPKYPNTPVTIRHLLTHSSSLVSVSMSGTGKEVLVSRIGVNKAWSARKPGGENSWEYSNAGYAALGAVLESASGKTLVDYADSYFFAPLGADASFHASNIKSKESIATLYRSDHKEGRIPSQFLEAAYSEIPGDNFSIYPGGLVISARDYAKLVCILANNGCYNGMYYLSEESVAEMEKVHLNADHYQQCIGLRYKENLIDGRNMYFHTGTMYGMLSFFCYDENGSGVVVFANGASVDTKRADGVAEVCEKAASYCLSLSKEAQ